jgi:hypothetical protein
MRGGNLGAVVSLTAALVLGAAASIFPLGAILKLTLIGGFGLAVIFAWQLRSERWRPPGTWFRALLLLTLVFSIVWPRYIYLHVGGASVNPQTISLFITLAAGAAALILSPELGRMISALNIFKHNFGKLMLAWIIWRLISSGFGAFPIDSMYLVLREIVYSLGFLLVGVLLLSSQEGERAALRVILVCSWVVILYGLIEAAAQRNFFTQFASGGDNDAAAEAIRSLIVEKVRGGRYRAQSVFSHPIVFSQYVAAALPMACVSVLKERNAGWRFAGALLVPVGLAAIALSGSRSGLLSLFSVAAFLIFSLWIRAIFGKSTSRTLALIMLPIVIVGAGLVGFALQDLVAGRSRVEAGSTESRQVMVSLGVKALQDRPLLGFGDGQALAKAGLTDSSGHASIDSYLLTVAIESGYVGLFFFVVAFLSFLQLCIGGIIGATLRDALELAAITSALFGMFIAFFGLSITHNLTFLWILMIWGLAVRQRIVWTSAHAIPA